MCVCADWIFCTAPKCCPHAVCTCTYIHTYTTTSLAGLAIAANASLSSSTAAQVYCRQRTRRGAPAVLPPATLPRGGQLQGGLYQYLILYACQHSPTPTVWPSVTVCWYIDIKHLHYTLGCLYTQAYVHTRVSWWCYLQLFNCHASMYVCTAHSVCTYVQ